jgi:hypothetical protein
MQYSAVRRFRVKDKTARPTSHGGRRVGHRSGPQIHFNACFAKPRHGLLELLRMRLRRRAKHTQRISIGMKEFSFGPGRRLPQRGLARIPRPVSIFVFSFDERSVMNMVCLPLGTFREGVASAAYYVVPGTEVAVVPIDPHASPARYPSPRLVPSLGNARILAAVHHGATSACAVVGHPCGQECRLSGYTGQARAEPVTAVQAARDVIGPGLIGVSQGG